MKKKSFLRDTGAADIFRRFKHKDFSGNTGQAIKNSTWQILTTIISKGGSLAFTLLLAWLLAPEMYGLFSLSLSTIILFSVFSDLGINYTLQTFLSKNIDASPKKAKAYFRYLLQIKIFLVIFSSFLLILFANFISNFWYKKPILFALLFGAIYIPILIFSEFTLILFTSKNNFKVPFFAEVILLITKLTVVPLIIFVMINKAFSEGIFVSFLILALSFCYLIVAVYYLVLILKSRPLGKAVFKEGKLDRYDKREIWKFMIPLSVTAFSGIFFGYIDTIMLGRYVTSDFVGFYSLAFNMVNVIVITISFSSLSLLPIFSRIKGEQLNRGFQKSKGLILMISFLILIVCFIGSFFAPWILEITHLSKYDTAIVYFRVLILLIISYPISSLYQTFYMSQKRTNVISIMLIISTLLNVILNYIFIKQGLIIGGHYYAVIGACIATIISRYFYLAGLVIANRGEKLINGSD